jgi:hypothetical protein
MRKTACPPVGKVHGAQSLVTPSDQSSVSSLCRVHGLFSSNRPEGDAQAADDEESGKPDRVAGPERVRFEHGKARVLRVDAAGDDLPDGVLRHAGLGELAFRRPWISPQGKMITGVGLALPLVAEAEVLTVFEGRVAIMPPLLDLRGKDDAADFRPSSHFPGPEKASCQ